MGLPSISPCEAYVDPDRPDVARVPIVSNKHAGMEAIIDSADLALVQGTRWHWSQGSAGRGMKAGTVVLAMDGSPKPTLARIILNVTDPDLQVSHVNGDKLDCRRANLVIRTRSEIALARKPSPETVARLRPYPDPDRPGVWRVPLKSYLADREALIDEADLPIVEGKNWNWHDRTDGRVEGEVIVASVTEQTPLSRLIMRVHGTSARVRYRNRDPLDCRRENLAVITLAEQARGNRKMEMRAGKKCTSRFKGVSWQEDRGKWVAQIRMQGVTRNLGRFEDELAAAQAYDEAARELFGEHARLNFPDGVDAYLEAEAQQVDVQERAAA